MESSLRIAPALHRPPAPTGTPRRTDERKRPAGASPVAPEAPDDRREAVHLALQPPLPRAAARPLPEVACCPLRARHCMTLANAFTVVVAGLGGALVGLLTDFAAEMSGLDSTDSTILGASIGTGAGVLLAACQYWLRQNRDRAPVAPVTFTGPWVPPPQSGPTPGPTPGPARTRPLSEAGAT